MVLRSKIDRLLEYFLSILMGLMVINVLWQVASRFLLNDPSHFTDELARFFLIWLGLIGAAYATGKGMHVAIRLLESRLNQRLRYYQKILIEVVVMFFAITVLIIGGIRLVMISFQLGQISSAMQISLGYVYLSLPLSGVITVYYSLSNIFILKSAVRGEY